MSRFLLRAEANLLFGRGMLAGIDRREQKKVAATVEVSTGSFDLSKGCHAKDKGANGFASEAPSAPPVELQPAYGTAHASKLFDSMPCIVCLARPSAGQLQFLAHILAADKSVYVFVDPQADMLRKLRGAAGIAETSDMRAAAREREARADKYDGFDMTVRARLCSCKQRCQALSI
jgi:hypothetical protein